MGSSKLAFLVAVGAIGCVEGAEPAVLGEEEPLEQARAAIAPPVLPEAMTLTLPVIVPGDTAFITVTGADPGDSVKLVRGNVGISCPAVLGGGCIGLGSASLLASAAANALGEAAFALVIPVGVPVGADLRLQAVVAGAAPYVSNVAEATTESVCGDAILQSDEDCDDGDVLSGDGCSPTCTVEVNVDDFMMRVIGATLTNRDPVTNDHWDFDPFGIFVDPDVYFLAYVDGVQVYRSNTANDDLTPRFNDTFPITVPNGSVLELEFWDEDPIPFPDYVGTIVLDHAALNSVVGAGPFVETDHGLASLNLDVL